MKLLIKNRKELINNLLDPVSTLNATSIVKVDKTGISSITSSSDSTLILYAKISIPTEVETSINLPDVKKLVRVLDCINDDEISLDIVSNNIKFNDGNFKFTYHLLEDGIIKAPAINITKIEKLQFDATYKITSESLSTLLKGSSFATETTKMYLYCEDNKFFGELGDKNRSNSDNFVCKLCDAPVTFSKVIPINFETFRLINFSKFKEIEISVNTQLSLVKVVLTKTDTKLIYIISALIS